MAENDIRILLQTIAIRTRKRYTHELREIGLFIGQELALSYLWEEDGITQSELRSKTGSEASTMSNMLKKLEHDGIVERRHDDHDHRKTKVYLTGKGRALREPVEAIWRAHEQTMFEGIRPEELLLLRRMLQQMDSNLEEG